VGDNSVKKWRVYLDNCCYNRPYDDQNNLLVFLETEAKLFVQNLILNQQLELVWSFVLDYENDANPYEERRHNILLWKKMSVIDCDLCDTIANDAAHLMELGLRQKDASHIACAMYAKADYFLTTDKKILNKLITDIQIISPIDFIKEHSNE
jgi:hypothetical protein